MRMLDRSGSPKDVLWLYGRARFYARSSSPPVMLGCDDDAIEASVVVLLLAAVDRDDRLACVLVMESRSL